MSSSTPTSSEIDMKKNLSLIILMALGLIFGVGADLNSLAYQNSPTKIDFVKGPFELSQNGAGDAAVSGNTSSGNEGGLVQGIFPTNLNLKNSIVAGNTVGAVATGPDLRGT